MPRSHVKAFANALIIELQGEWASSLTRVKVHGHAGLPDDVKIDY